MSDYMRKMICEMMAQEAMDLDTHQTLTYDHPNVCRSYLEGFCVNLLFVNTRLDCGECSKIHSTKLRDEYLAAKSAGADLSAIDSALERLLAPLVVDCTCFHLAPFFLPTIVFLLMPLFKY